MAFIFGGAFFFDLFWPERREDKGIRWAWKLCAVFESLLMLGSALTMTVWHTVQCWRLYMLIWVLGHHGQVQRTNHRDGCCVCKEVLGGIDEEACFEYVSHIYHPHEIS